MTTCHIVVEGRTVHTVSLPEIPSPGSIVAVNPDPKTNRYLITLIEYVSGYAEPNLHAKEFVNQDHAVNHTGGYRNIR